MLNILWPFFIIISFVYAFLTGNIENVNNSIFDYSSKAVNLTITFLGTICLWTGIIKILENTTIIKKMTLILQPFINFLFPDMKKNEKAKEEISMNIVANILGLGNAATPIGLKAMKTMQEDNKNKEILSDSMAMFIVINTASIQIIPTTVIAIRNSLNSSNSTNIIIPVWIATVASAIAGIISTKLFIKINKK